MSPIVLNVPESRSSTAGQSSNLASSGFVCLVQSASQRHCQAKCTSNNAVIASDSTRGAAIDSFDVDVADASGTVPASTEDKKDETGNTGKRSGSATNKTSGSPERDYVCDTCNRIFTRKYSLKRHIKTMHNHGSLPFKCDSCDAAFSRMDMLNRHKGRMHSNNSSPFKCDSCQKTFSSISTLNRHTQSLHSDTMGVGCDVCGKTFRRNDSLIRHKKVHSGNKPFECKICHKKFAYKQNRNIHQTRCEQGPKDECNITTMHKDGSLPFKCDSCQKTFSRISTLNRHTSLLHSDTDTMGVGCDVCGKMFRRNDCLIRHKKIHSGHKPFECEICHKKFTYKQKRDIHQTKCKQGPKYECNKSGEKFPGKMTTVWADSFFRHRTL